MNNLQGSQRQFGLPGSYHNWRNCLCVRPQLGLQILPWSDATGCRLWWNDMDLPPWTLFCPMESLPTIFGNHLFSGRWQIVISRLEYFLDMFYTIPAEGLSKLIKWPILYFGRSGRHTEECRYVKLLKIRSLFLLPLLLSTVCMTWDVGARLPSSWQLPTMLSRLKFSLPISLF